MLALIAVVLVVLVIQGIDASALPADEVERIGGV